MDGLIFWIGATVAIAASVLVVGQRNPMYSVLLLIVSFAALAGLYVQLDAPFVAAIQIIIYAGAIMVLFLFVVMLLNASTEISSAASVRLIGGAGPRRFGAVLAALLAVQLYLALSGFRAAPFPDGDVGDRVADVFTIGVTLFREYAFAFEATSILILVAMVGAIILARKEG